MLVMAVAACLSPASAEAQDLTLEMAKRHFQNGAAYYDRANYAMALEEFQRAYRLESAPELLYNMGRCHEGLGQTEQAIARFEAYLAAKPGANNAPVVQARIKNLRGLLQSKAPKPTPAATPGKAPAAAAQPEQAPTPTRRREAASLKLAGWATLGGGAAVMVAGAILGGVALQKTGEYEDGYARHMAYDEAQGILDQAEAMETGMFVCLGLGAAAAVTGVVLLILDGSGETSSASASLGSATLRPTLSGLALDF